MSKIGRPTDAKKDICIKIRIDDETNRKLEICMKMERQNRSEVIRQSILDKYNKLMEGNYDEVYRV